MLTDHRDLQERWAADARRHRRNIQEYGDFFQSMEPDWMVTITFDTTRHHTSHPKALDSVKRYLAELEDAAGRSIAWVIAEDLGAVGHHLHFHILVSNVGHLDMRVWWRIAFQRFGRTKIDWAHGTRRSYYVAKNGLSENGNLHFGGQLLSGGTRLNHAQELLSKSLDRKPTFRPPRRPRHTTE